MDNSNSVSSSQGSAWFSQVTEDVTSFFSDIGSRLNVVFETARFESLSAGSNGALKTKKIESLIDLPQDVLYCIYQNLKVKDILMLERTKIEGKEVFHTDKMLKLKVSLEQENLLGYRTYLPWGHSARYLINHHFKTNNYTNIYKIFSSLPNHPESNRLLCKTIFFLNNKKFRSIASRLLSECRQFSTNAACDKYLNPQFARCKPEVAKYEECMFYLYNNRLLDSKKVLAGCSKGKDLDYSSYNAIHNELEDIIKYYSTKNPPLSQAFEQIRDILHPLNPTPV